MSTNGELNRKLRMALVGGGQGAFIGRVHSTAAVLDNRAALVAGALSSDPQKAKASAPDYDIPLERAYGSYKELVEKGKLIKKTIDLLTASLDMSRVMIELPGPWISDVRSCDIEDMKKALVNALGPDVNLANVPPASIIDTEATRTGLGTAGPPKQG